MFFRRDVTTRVLIVIACSLFFRSAFSEPIVLSEGTSIDASIFQTVTSITNSLGQRVYFIVDKDVVIDDQVVIRKGTFIEGKVGDTKTGNGQAPKGSVTVFPMQTTAVDGTRVFFRNDELGAMSTDATAGRQLQGSVLWGGNLGNSKNRRSYILKGSLFQLTVSKDATVDPAKLATIRTAETPVLTYEGEFDSTVDVNVMSVDPREYLEATIQLHQKVSKKEVRESFGPGDVKVVRVMNRDLPIPVTASLVKLNSKELQVRFPWWNVIQYTLPGETTISIMIEVGDGQFALANLPLKTKWDF